MNYINEGRNKKKIVFTSGSHSSRSGSWSCYGADSNIDKKPYEKELILNSKTGHNFEYTVGIEPLTGTDIEDLGRKLSNSFIANCVRQYLPTMVGKYFYHASVFIMTDVGGTVIEYGTYRGQDDYKEIGQSTHYLNGDGLRFVHMTWEQYKKKLKLKDGLLEDKMRYIDLHSYCNLTIDEILEKCGSNWGCLDYDGVTHNCQDFVAKFVEVTGGVREEGKFCRGFHTAAKLEFPWKILKQIEKNEDDFFTTVEKIPILGPTLAGIKAWGKIIGKAFK